VQTKVPVARINRRVAFCFADFVDFVTAGLDLFLRVVGGAGAPQVFLRDFVTLGVLDRKVRLEAGTEDMRVLKLNSFVCLFIKDQTIVYLDIKD
jgi:hypothetical protein